MGAKSNASKLRGSYGAKVTTRGASVEARAHEDWGEPERYMVTCPTCKGEQWVWGTHTRVTCPTCEGTGEVEES